MATIALCQQLRLLAEAEQNQAVLEDDLEELLCDEQ